MTPCSFCAAHNALEAQTCRACGAPLRAGESTTLPVGTRLQNGAFEIERVLGRGGFGVTYEARDLMLERSVAIKEFFPHDAARQGAMVLPGVLRPEEYRAARGKFLQEARMLARFKHPGIVDVYGVFEENNSVYMTMEFARGKTLGQLLHARNAPMDESEAVGYLRQVGEALAVVHDAGLLHRDIKPENVVVDMGRALLIDFGTAGEQSSALNAGPRRPVVVTPGYAPLEQYAQSARRGPFTDVYALGATLYHLLSGQAPPPAPDVAKGVEIRPLQELNPKVSATVAQTVQASLQTEVARRPQTVRAFLCGLDGSISYAPEIEADEDVQFGDADYDILNRRARAIQDLARGHREALGYLPPLTPKAAANVAAPHIAAPVVRVPSAPQAPVAAPASSVAPSPASNGVAVRSRSKVRPIAAVAGGLILLRVAWAMMQPPPYRYTPYDREPSWRLEHNSWKPPQTRDVRKSSLPLFGSQARITRVEESPGPVVFSHDRALMALSTYPGASRPMQVQVRNTRTGRIQSVVPINLDSFEASMLFSPDGRLLAAASEDDGNLRLYDVRTGARKKTLERPDEKQIFSDAMSFSADGREFMSRVKTQIFCWDVRTGKMLREIKLPFDEDENTDGWHSLAAFAPNGKTWVSEDASGAFRWFDIKRGSYIVTRPIGWQPKAPYNRELVFSPDSARAACGDQAGLRILSAQEQAPLGLMALGEAKPLCFSPDNRLLIGQRLGTSTSYNLCVWDARSGALLQTLPTAYFYTGGVSYPGSIDAAAFTSDGQTLRAFGNNGTILEWKRISQTRQTAPVARRVVPRRRVKPAVIPPVHVQFAHSQPPSQIMFSETVPPALDMPGLDAKTQILKRYNAWKAAHAASNLATLLQFYAPDAQTTVGSVDNLRRYLEHNEGQNRQSIQDLQTPKWWFRTDGEQVVLDASLRYLNGWGRNEAEGTRRLFWQQRDGQWMIVRDSEYVDFSSTPSLKF